MPLREAPVVDGPRRARAVGPAERVVEAAEDVPDAGVDLNGPREALGDREVGRAPASERDERVPLRLRSVRDAAAARLWWKSQYKKPCMRASNLA